MIRWDGNKRPCLASQRRVQLGPNLSLSPYKLSDPDLLSSLSKLFIFRPPPRLSFKCTARVVTGSCALGACFFNAWSNIGAHRPCILHGRINPIHKIVEWYCWIQYIVKRLGYILKYCSRVYFYLSSFFFQCLSCLIVGSFVQSEFTAFPAWSVWSREILKFRSIVSIHRYFGRPLKFFPSTLMLKLIVASEFLSAWIAW